MIHVGISGPIASGKSTLANKLREIMISHGYTAEVIPFATGIRELLSLEGNMYRKVAMAQMLFDWGFDIEKAQIAALLIDQYMVEYPTQRGTKNRRLLQLVGTEVGRDLLGADTWIMRTQQIARRYEILDFLISDDLRFDNEALAVDIHVRIELTRPTCYNARVSSMGMSYMFDKHASEQSLTLPPLLTIPVCFQEQEVQDLYSRLEHGQRLRHGR